MDTAPAAQHGHDACAARIRQLETEVANLRLQVRREQLTTRCVLSAVADFGGAIAMDRATGFGPAAPDVVLDLVDTVTRHRDQHRRRLPDIAPIADTA